MLIHLSTIEHVFFINIIIFFIKFSRRVREKLFFLVIKLTFYMFCFHYLIKTTRKLFLMSSRILIKNKKKLRETKKGIKGKNVAIKNVIK